MFFCWTHTAFNSPLKQILKQYEQILKQKSWIQRKRINGLACSEE